VIKDQKSVAGNLRKPFFLISRFSSGLQLLGTFVSVAVLMAFYETLKEIYFKGGLTLVESHAITVVVSATLATIASTFIRRKAFELHAAVEDAANMAESVITNIFEAVVIMDSDGSISTFNPAAQKIFGYQASEVIGQSVNMLMSQAYASAHDGFIRRYLDTKVPAIVGKNRREVSGLRSNGETFPMDLIVSQMNFNDKLMFIGIIRDISDYKQAEIETERLRQAEMLIVANLKKEMLIAAAIQKNMLPKNTYLLQHFPEIKAFGISRPAKEMGGDFYDAFAIDTEYLVFAIGDVSGKGVSAALFMMEVMALLRSQMTRSSKFPTAVNTVNRLLCRNNEANMFVSLFVGLLNVSTGNLDYINCGHDVPLFSTGNEPFKTLNVPKNILLGIHEDASFELAHIRMKHGDTLVLYTDGVTEAENDKREFFTLKRTLGVLSTTYPDAKVLVHGVLNAVDDFRGVQAQYDDITVFAIQYLPDDLSTARKSFFEWSSDLCVGIDVIDEQHRTLVDLINRLYEEIITKGSSNENQEEILEELIRYAIYHFDFEEELLRKNGYAEIDAHCGYHARLKKKLLALLENIKTSSVTVNTELLGFLKAWLQQHIALEDKSAFS
jgi:hemerythrin-like metal-binding protein/PAS domain S-box-containing protein